LFTRSVLTAPILSGLSPKNRRPALLSVSTKLAAVPAIRVP